MHRTRRLAVLVLSLALIAPGSASAAGPKSEPGRESASSRLWGWLTNLWAEAGCIMDPDGCSGTQGDEGCIIDPDGCAAAQSDAGCILDPNGCADAHGDAGCIADPNGGTCAEGQ